VRECGAPEDHPGVMAKATLSHCGRKSFGLEPVSSIALAVVVALAVVHPAASGQRKEPPLIRPWHQIGSVGLGMLRSSVAYRYGAQSDRFAWQFRVPGGELDVGFAGDRVSQITTSSGYYRAPQGLHVGSVIPLGPCHRISSNPCEHRWNGFVYRGRVGVWSLTTCYAGIPVYADLVTGTGGVVTHIAVGFGSTALCTSKPMPPLSSAEKAGITSAIRTTFTSSTITVTSVRYFVSPDSTHEYAGATVFGNYKKGGGQVQPAFVIVRHVGGRWRTVDYGTSGVGCGKVPIKYLAEMNLTCPG
jgi:hypothetical protein